MKTPTNKRNGAIDLIKAFAIICVVLGHCIQFGSGANYYTNQLFFENPIFETIYSFHMPLFMLISGYFFGHTATKYSWGKTILNKVQSLLIPIFIWSLLPLSKWVFQTVTTCSSIPPLYEIIKTYVSLSLHSLWFLWAVFWCSFIVIVVKRFLNDSYLVHILLFCLSFLAPDRLFNLLSDIYLYKFMYPFFVAGYYVYSHKSKSIHLLLNNSFTLPILLFLYIVLLLFFNTDSYIYTTKFNILRNSIIDTKQVMIDFYRFAIGFIGSLLFILILLKVFPLLHKHLQSFLTYIGRKTLGIYIISGYIFESIVLNLTKGFSSFNPIIAISECIIILTISVLLCEIIQRVKVVRLLLLGSK